jgi:lipoate-protein ligase A
MIWYHIDTGQNNGLFNMQFDIDLINLMKNQNSVLRFYQWKPYCISLGANQCISEIDIDKAKADNIDIVKRPTGGRAILHSDELTYSVVFPLSSEFSARKIYNEVNLAIKKGLELFNPILKRIELENKQIDLKNFYKKDISSACFAVSSQFEINFEGKKLVGSAQRKIGNAVLQHGSILCGNFHLKLVNYLNLNSLRKNEILEELKNTTIDLKTILKKEIEINFLSECIKKGFEEHFNIAFKKLNV